MNGKARSMGMLKVSHLKPQMVVCGDLKDKNGRLLVAAGTRLTENHIRIIKIWGVIEADIEGVSEADVVPPEEAMIDPELLRAAAEALAVPFRYNDLEEPALAELFRIGRRRKALEMANSSAAGGSPPPPPPPLRAPPKRWDDIPPGILLTEENPIDQIRRLIRRDIKLTTLPAIFNRINEAIMKPSSSSHDIADLISKDTSLSARLLKLVNSAFYGYPSQIDSLARAVSIVGTNQLNMLAFGIDITSAFKNIPGDYINMDSFWRHSILCGIIARLIAAQKNIQNTERLFLAGMLHDVGRLVIYIYAPRHAVKILEQSRETGQLLSSLETENLGGDHAEIGGLLLQVWKLPQSLETAVRHHHASNCNPNGLESAIVHIADVAAKALGVGSSGDPFIPPMNPAAWRQVGLSVNSLEPIVDQADRQLEETFQLFFK
jgi:HD-like signal output (HDOD) protein